MAGSGFKSDSSPTYLSEGGSSGNLPNLNHSRADAVSRHGWVLQAVLSELFYGRSMDESTSQGHEGHLVH